MRAFANTDRLAVLTFDTRRALRGTLAGLTAALLILQPSDTLAASEDWAQWRGPESTGVAPDGDPPVEWSEQKNIRWKASIPGKGLASPVIWGDQVFVLTAIETGEGVVAAAEPQEEQQAPATQGHRRRRRGMRGVVPKGIYEFAVLALSRTDGSVLWQRVVRREKPHEGTHADASWASTSPVTDGEFIYASFGSRGIYCLDMEGNVLWEQDLGDMSTKMSFGEGSSPALAGDRLIVTWDHEGDSFIAALSTQTGEELWRVARDEHTSWATPLVVEHDGRTHVIASGTNKVRSYDADTGEVIWECGGMTPNAIPTPVTADGVVYIASGFRGDAVIAVPLATAKGDITGTDAVAWKVSRDAPYVPSPLLYGDMLYFLKRNNAILTCLDAATGELHFGPQRLEGLEGAYASPVGAADRIYIAARNGATAVLKRGAVYESLAVNMLDESFAASPAIAGDALFLRGQSSLYCIARLN